MGVVSFDVAASSRRLETAFPLHTEDGVKSFMGKIRTLEELKYFSGDFDVVIWLADFYDVLFTVGLSPTEHKIIYFVYFEGYKQSELVEKLGLKKNTINTLLKRGIKKITGHYARIRKAEEEEHAAIDSKRTN